MTSYSYEMPDNKALDVISLEYAKGWQRIALCTNEDFAILDARLKRIDAQITPSSTKRTFNRTLNDYFIQGR